MGPATWGTLLLASAVTIVVIGLPGALVGVSLRLRGLWLAAAIPPLGLTSIVVASGWAAAIGVKWALWPVLLTALVIAAISFTAFAVVPRARRSVAAPPTGWKWAVPIAVGTGVTLLTARFVTAIGEPDWFAQNGDMIFHLNAVRWILDHGDASPFGLMSLGAQPRATFYPDAWHATVSLVCQLTGVTIPVATNAMLFLVACVIWPLGVILLTRSIFGTRAPLLVAAGALSAGFGTFPFMLVSYMGTLPLVLAVALVPLSVALVATTLGLARAGLPRVMAIATLVLSLPGLGDAHPSAVIMLAALSTPLVLAAMWSLGRRHPDRRRLAALISTLYFAGVLALIVFIRPTLVQPNAARSSPGQAVGEVLTGAFVGTQIPVVLAALTIVGIIAAVRREGLSGWMTVGLWLTLSLIYIAAAGHDEFWRLLISQPWYSDASRVAAFAPITIVPLAALGADRAWVWACSVVAFDAHRGRERAAQVIAVVLLGGLMLQSTAVRDDDKFMRVLFTPTDNQLMAIVPLSADDRALLARLPRFVPADGVIAGDPWTGASFAYALTGRRVLVPHLLAPITLGTRELLDGLSTSSSDGPACRAARDLGVGWVLEPHGGKTLPGMPQRPGLQGLAQSPNVRLVDRVGDSSLYQIVGCE